MVGPFRHSGVVVRTDDGGRFLVHKVNIKMAVYRKYLKKVMFENFRSLSYGEEWNGIITIIKIVKANIVLFCFAKCK